MGGVLVGETYCESTCHLRRAGFGQLLCGFVGPFGEFLAGCFVGLEVGYCDVGVVGGEDAQAGLASVDEGHEGGHG